MAKVVVDFDILDRVLTEMCREGVKDPAHALFTALTNVAMGMNNRKVLEARLATSMTKQV